MKLSFLDTSLRRKKISWTLKVHHQKNVKYSFDLYNESNTHNSSGDVILMKETDSLGIQQKIIKHALSQQLKQI